MEDRNRVQSWDMMQYSTLRCSILLPPRREFCWVTIQWPKVCGCYLVTVFLFSILYRQDLHLWYFCVSAYLQKPDWQSDFPWFSALLMVIAIVASNYGYSSKEYTGPPIVWTIKCRVVNKIWKRSPFSFKHVSLWYTFLDPHLTTQHSNIGVCSRQITNWNSHTVEKHFAL